MVIIELLREYRGWLPGSRCKMLKGAGLHLQGRGIAKIVDDPSEKAKKRNAGSRKTTRKLDPKPDATTSIDAGDAERSETEVATGDN